MKNTISLLFPRLLIGVFFFCFLNVKSQKNANNKILISEDSIYIQKRTQKTVDYFNEIVFNTEFNGKLEKAFKWDKNMKIYVEGKKINYLMIELDDIVLELNNIINTIDIEIVNNPKDANMFIYFGSSDDFYNYCPNVSRSLLTNNWGLFMVTIVNSYMYVDINRANEVEQKHLLREELTQSLGLFNDSYKYPESIYYQGWTTTTEYAPIDVELIEMLYNE
jgi:hypothetical protein